MTCHFYSTVKALGPPKMCVQSFLFSPSLHWHFIGTVPVQVTIPLLLVYYSTLLYTHTHLDPFPITSPHNSLPDLFRTHIIMALLRLKAILAFLVLR